MRQVVKDMIEIYNIKNLKYDFMGYTFDQLKELSFHHLLIPKKDCKNNAYNGGYFIWNGAILKQATSHDYLHLIERIDRELFLRITKYIAEENRNKKIDIDNLKRIREILLLFEDMYSKETDKHGKQLIKTIYITDRIPL